MSSATHRWCVSCALVIGLVSTAQPALGDGVFYRDTKLRDLVGEDGFALGVDVLSKVSSSGRFRGKATAIWGTPKGAPFSIGGTYELALPPVFKFSPGKSIIVRRYWDDSPRDAVSTGAKVVLLYPSPTPHLRTLAAIVRTPRLETRLDVVFTPGGEKSYRRKRTVAQLEGDLTDLDLLELAYSTLSRRNKLRDRAIIKAAPAMKAYDLFGHHVSKLSSKRRSAFLLKVARHLKRSPNKALEHQLVKRFRDGLAEAELPALDTLYLGALNPSDREDAYIMARLNEKILEYLKTPSAKRDATRFVKHYLKFIPTRPRSESVGRNIAEYHGLLPDREGTKLLVKLMGSTGPPHRAQVDYPALSLIMSNVKLIPARRVVGFMTELMKSIDYESFDRCRHAEPLAKAVLHLSDTRRSSSKKLVSLAKAVSKLYICNTDDGLRRRLEKAATP